MSVVYSVKDLIISRCSISVLPSHLLDSTFSVHWENCEEILTWRFLGRKSVCLDMQIMSEHRYWVTAKNQTTLLLLSHQSARWNGSLNIFLSGYFPWASPASAGAVSKTQAASTWLKVLQYTKLCEKTWKINYHPSGQYLFVSIAAQSSQAKRVLSADTHPNTALWCGHGGRCCFALKDTYRGVKGKVGRAPESQEHKHRAPIFTKPSGKWDFSFHKSNV